MSTIVNNMNNTTNYKITTKKQENTKTTIQKKSQSHTPTHTHPQLLTLNYWHPSLLTNSTPPTCTFTPQHHTKKKYIKNQKKNNKTKNHQKIYSKTPKKTINKMQHITNGNYNIKIMTWNTSKAKLVNKIDIINHTIQQHSPKIIAIQELHFTSNDDLADVTIPGYKIEMDQMLQTTGRARSALIIHESQDILEGWTWKPKEKLMFGLQSNYQTTKKSTFSACIASGRV